MNHYPRDPEQPKPISEDEFIDRLIKAGWTKEQAEREWQEIQEETESGMP